MTVAPVQAVGLPGLDAITSTGGAGPASGATFANLLAQGVDTVNRKVVDADALVRAFALDDSIPLHQVTYALEQAKISVKIMMQVRARLLEGYQELLRMQL